MTVCNASVMNYVMQWFMLWFPAFPAFPSVPMSRIALRVFCEADSPGNSLGVGTRRLRGAWLQKPNYRGPGYNTSLTTRETRWRGALASLQHSHHYRYKGAQRGPHSHVQSRRGVNAARSRRPEANKLSQSCHKLRQCAGARPPQSKSLCALHSWREEP